MEKVIFLDRDGVINHESINFIKNPEEWIPIENSIQAIVNLHHSGYKVFVVTNQSGIARGLINRKNLDLIHKKMFETVEVAGGKISGIYYCPHGPNDVCDCRKPKAGLLDNIKREYKLDLSEIPFVGDSERDLLAAISRKCAPVLVRTGNGKNTESKLREQNISLLNKILIFDDLLAVSEYLLK